VAARCASSSSRETQVASARTRMPPLVHRGCSKPRAANRAPFPTPTRIIGIASFYGSTAAALAESLDASAAVVGFRGHTLNPLLSPTQAFDLEQQVGVVG